MWSLVKRLIELTDEGISDSDFLSIVKFQYDIREYNLKGFAIENTSTNMSYPWSNVTASTDW